MPAAAAPYDAKTSASGARLLRRLECCQNAVRVILVEVKAGFQAFRCPLSRGSGTALRLFGFSEFGKDLFDNGIVGIRNLDILNRVPPHARSIGTRPHKQHVSLE